jgi:ABC-type Fe3+/spermidine/putrescine transport system ATPase subunit
MVFQSYALFNHLTVADNIKFGLQVRQKEGRGDCNSSSSSTVAQLGT